VYLIFLVCLINLKLTFLVQSIILGISGLFWVVHQKQDKVIKTPKLNMERSIIKMAVNPIPDGYHTITPYLIVEGAARLIDFLGKAFDAQELEKMLDQEGRIVHAEVRIGDSRLMVSDPGENNPPTHSLLHLYLGDTDSFYKRALEAGATSIREPRDEFYGDRTAGVKDAFGNQWWMATHIEDVPTEELERRAAAQNS
jgi:PhnB protein